MRIALAVLGFVFSVYAWSDDFPMACFDEIVSAGDREVIFGWLEKNEGVKGVEDQALFAFCALAVGKNEVALESINSVLAEDNEFPFARELRGEVYMALGRFSDAIEDFRASILSSAGSGREHYYIARAYYSEHKIDEALKVLYERVDYFNKYFPVPAHIERESFEEVKIYRFLGEILSRSGDGESAVSVLEGGYRRNSLSVELFEDLMYSFLDLGMRDRYDSYVESYCDKPLIDSSVHCGDAKYSGS